MKKEDVIRQAEEFVRLMIRGYDGGHDWWHTDRVRKLAKYINDKEKLADPFIVDLAALLHDTVDSKFSGQNSEPGYQKLREFLQSSGLEDIQERMLQIIRNVSFSNKQKTGDLSDPVLLIVQDADKLDAMGATGVARAFNYGGFRNNIIYSPVEEENKYSTINHFYEKLLLLRSMMNTLTGKEMAAERHQFLETFLEQFFREVNLFG